MPSAIRINAGGNTFTASGSRQFIADTYYGGIDRTGFISSGDILNTTDDVLYRTERSATSFNYSIPVQNGTVNVVLHFAETWWGAPGRGTGGAGKRMFNVDIEGSRKLTNYDIYAKAGGAMKAMQETIPITVTDGMLNINFLSGSADMPQVSAIEVLPQTGVVNSAPVLAAIGNKSVTLGQTLSFTASATDADAGQAKTFLLVSAPTGATINAATGVFTWKPATAGIFTFTVKVTDDGSPALSDEKQLTVTVTDATPPSTVRINSGGPAASTAIGDFAADAYSTGATGTYSTSSDVLYQTYRRSSTVGGSFGYSIPVANGTYTVKLHFAEIYHTAAGKRKFNVTAEGAAWLSNYDIFAAAGASKRAVTAIKTVTVSDGFLTLNFASLIDRACVSAIQVLPQTASLAAVATAELSAGDASGDLVNKEEEKASLMVYPNPNPGDKVVIEMSDFGKNEEATLVLYDVRGRAIQTKTVVADENGFIHTNMLFNSILSRGVYMITATSETTKVSAKLVVW